MEEEGLQHCKTCPAFAEIPGEQGAGTCRSMPPVVMPADAPPRNDEDCPPPPPPPKRGAGVEEEAPPAVAA